MFSEATLNKTRTGCRVQCGYAFSSIWSSRRSPRRRARRPPPEETYEEAAYLKNLGEKQRSVSIKLADGEIIRGWIEYYDKNMIRVTREGEPNLFIFKHDIMYIAEDGKKK